MSLSERSVPAVTGWWPLLRSYLGARRAPERLIAIGLAGALGMLLARFPAPGIRTGLDSVGYPAVLVGALVPVLIGVIGAAPAQARLRWITAVPTARTRVLRTVEYTVITASAGLAAGLCGVPAHLVTVAVQNALITFFAIEIVALATSAGLATTAVGAASVVVLLLSPGLAPAPWVAIDTLSDAADWIVLAVLGLGALSARQVRRERLV